MYSGHVYLLIAIIGITRGQMPEAEAESVAEVKSPYHDVCSSFNESFEREDSILRYLMHFATRTGLLSNITSMMHELGTTINSVNMSGFKRLFSSLNVESRGADIVIDDFLVYHTGSKKFDILRSDNLAANSALTDEQMKLFVHPDSLSDPSAASEGKECTTLEIMEMVGKFVSSRPFLFMLAHYQSCDESARAEFYPAAINNVQRVGCNGAQSTGLIDEEKLFSAFSSLREAEEALKKYPCKSYMGAGISDQWGGVELEGRIARLWAEDFVYKTVHFLCNKFELTIDCFENGEDTEFLEFLRHSIEVGHVHEFEVDFKKKAVQILRDINKKGVFAVAYGDDGNLKCGFVNILGVMGNFLEKMLDQMGVKELVRLHDIAGAHDALIVGMRSEDSKFHMLFSELVSAIFNLPMLGKVAYVRKTNPENEYHVNDDHKILFGVHQCEQEIIGNIEVHYAVDNTKYVITSQGPGLMHYDCPKLEVRPARTSRIAPVCTGVPILDAFAELERKILLKDLNLPSLASDWPEMRREFLNNPMTMLVRGDMRLPQYRQLGIHFLRKLHEDTEDIEDLIQEALQRRVSEAMIKMFGVGEVVMQQSSDSIRKISYRRQILQY